jgi:hypothetical protein
MWRNIIHPAIDLFSEHTRVTIGRFYLSLKNYFKVGLNSRETDLNRQFEISLEYCPTSTTSWFIGEDIVMSQDEQVQVLSVDPEFLESIIKNKSILSSHLTICNSPDQLDIISQFVCLHISFVREILTYDR